MKIRQQGILSQLGTSKIYRNGAWVQIKAYFVREGNEWVVQWQHLITATVTATATNLAVATLFTPEVWASNTPKEVVIEQGVIVGSSNPATAALIVSNTWNGVLTVRNFGRIEGAGGVANGGAGGDAIKSDKAGLLVINETGSFIGGGGGGAGKGGKGGNGTYTSVQREPTSGWADRTKHYMTQKSGRKSWIWNGSQVSTASSNPTVGSWTYIGKNTPWEYTQVWEGNGDSGGNVQVGWFEVYRQRSVTNDTTGGAGGNGGRGQGYGQALANGSNGSAGTGTNAGTGGKGGNGAAWGVAGASGSKGANGTVTNGAAGAAGGAAGRAIRGQLAVVTNNGTIAGAYN